MISNEAIRSDGGKSISLWCSYVGKGAPSNAAGARRGYGRTREEASRNAGHWNNQAPWARLRRMSICDQRSWSVVSESARLAVEALIPDLSGPEHEFSPREQRELTAEAWRLARDGKTASAIALYLGGLKAGAS